MTADSIIDGIIEREGGYVNHPADRGGPTKFGITQRVLADWRARPVSPEEVKAMHVEEARAIYSARYVRLFANLPDCLLKVQLIDIGVNSGVKQAIRLLQRILGVECDGKFGPRTAAALAAHGDWRLLNNLLVGERMMFYAKLCKRKPSQLAFLVGWTDRARAFLL